MNNCGIFLTFIFLIAFGQCAFDFEGFKLFMTGYLKSLKIRDADVPHMLTCLGDDKTGRVRFTELMNKVDRLDYSNLPLLADHMEQIFDVLKRGTMEVATCTQDVHYDRLFTKIYRMMKTTGVKRLMLNFISNPQQIFKDIEDAVDNYIKGKFKELGVDLGDVMHIILTFAVDEPDIKLPDYLKILKGLFTGLNIKNDVDSVLKCIEAVPSAIERLVVILRQLKDIDIKKLDELIEIFKQVYREIKILLGSLSVCAESVPELKALIAKILSVDILKVIEIVMKNYVAIFGNLIKAKDAFLNKEYQVFGELIGGILYQLFLANKLIMIE